jgi:hypothetical protein
MFRAGDIVDGRLPTDGTGQSHKCIVLEDSVINEHTKCIPICNFTGTEPPSSGISVDISEYDLTDLAFVNKKTSSWIFCNMKDCIYGTIQSQHVYGNIKDKYPKLWAKVCQAAYSCPESERLQNVCDCHFEEIVSAIENCEIEPPTCGCT